MSLRQHARQVRGTLTNALTANYGRYMPYSRIVDKINRRPLLHDFKQKHANVPAFPSRESMWSYIVSRAPAAIDYLEFGVHRGNSISYFAEQNDSINSRFFGFDCFTGLPEDWNSDFKRGHFDNAGRAPDTADRRVEFVVGMFQETLPAFIANFTARNKIIVNLDCDLYASALYCLTKLDAVLPAGTVLIFDEFGDVLHEFRALNDYISSYRREVKVICSHDNFFTIAVELV